MSLSADIVAYYRDKIKKMGRWTGVRYLRNQGLTFSQAYFVMFNRLPRLR